MVTAQDPRGTPEGHRAADEDRDGPVLTGAGRVRVGGAVCLAAGLLSAGGNGYLAVVGPAGGGPFGYPVPVAGTTVLQMALALTPVAVIVGLVALRRSGALPRTRRARLGYGGAVVSSAGLTSAWGIAVTVTPASPGGGPSGFGEVHAGYVLVLGSCLFLAGLEVARRGPWAGWHRRLPCALGAWLVVPVVPSLAAGFRAASWAITGWCALLALLGLVLVREAPRAGDRPDGRRPRAAPSARVAAVLTWVYVAGFGSAAVPVTAHLLHTGTLPDFLGLFTMYGGPLWHRLPVGAFVLAMAAFVAVTLLAGRAAWLLWDGSRTGATLTLVLLPVEAAFWIGFALPLPWIIGACRLLLVVVAWPALDRGDPRSAGAGSGRHRVDVELSRRRSTSADAPAEPAP